jgi:hypothetical protein
MKEGKLSSPAMATVAAAPTNFPTSGDIMSIRKQDTLSFNFGNKNFRCGAARPPEFLTTNLRLTIIACNYGSISHLRRRPDGGSDSS